MHLEFSLSIEDWVLNFKLLDEIFAVVLNLL